MGVLFNYIAFLIVAIQISFGCTKTSFKLNILSKNISANLHSTSPTTADTDNSLNTVKKWQVGRVSRKHYEIVNMLWRKTKIFINPEATTPYENRFRRNSPTATSRVNANIKPLTFSSTRPVFSSSTPSYIEFYYLDDNDERIKRRDSLVSTLTSHNIQRRPTRDNLFIRSPILSLSINDNFNNPSPKMKLEIDKEALELLPQIRKLPIIHQKPSIYGFLSNFQIDVPVMKSNTFMSNLKRTTEHYFDNETCPLFTEPETNDISTTNPDISKRDVALGITTNLDNVTTKVHNSTNNTAVIIEATTAYDKIKFFEMYDQHTMKPFRTINTNDYRDDSENMVIGNEIDMKHKVNLQDVDYDIDLHDGSKIKNVKKHIDENLKSIVNDSNNAKIEKKIKFKTVLFNVNKTENKKSSEAEATNKAFKRLQDDSWSFLKNSSRAVMLSEYPFAAVYIYEPSQIHCDAAALSPHWLVAAGSCLSRFQQKDPLTESVGRSAFVAFCGLNWWNPERVSYVKYSIVHPRFHPKDATRRVLYNIGLIQVVGSMSTCFGWASLSLMSHNFASDSDGSMATAVGWGLDRYDVRYTSVDLPKQPLSAYEGFLFSNRCPGSKAFSEVSLHNDDSGLKNNLYCLSLPPYSGEVTDPVHGSLLLVGGKLIALYLQEERRFWGEQSAQYTGIWRLVPWVHEVAREPDDADGFSIDI